MPGAHGGESPYDDGFFDYTDGLARRGADAVVPVVRRWVDVDSVLDVGCGRGGWLAAWREAGAGDVVGVDGDYVDPARLLIPGDAFVPHDLARPLDLGRRFDLVQSLEVAEHLPEADADTFLDGLVRHGDVVLFSAAPPGQGGLHHVNEQPYAWWGRRFAERGYAMIDVVRPAVAHLTDVPPWYRYNPFLFVAEAALAERSDLAAHRLHPTTGPVRDVAPLGWRLRCRLVRRLPRHAADALARLTAARRARRVSAAR